MTLKEVEEEYKVAPTTLRAYISRGKVIPEDKKVKLGNQWLIERKFAEEKWGYKMKNTKVIINQQN